MGTKRIGLARIEALLEAQNRDLAMAGSTLKFRRPVVLLEDQGGAGAIRTALTKAESGTLFTVPALTSGTQTLAMPALEAAIVGCTYTFVMVGTAGQIFNVETDASATKVVAAKPDGAGNNTAISQVYNLIGFKAAAVIGSSFSITCVSATAATAWLAHDVIDGLAANVGSINLA